MEEIPNNVNISTIVVDCNKTDSPTMTHVNDQTERHDYVPVQPYWFYSRKNLDQITWIPFLLIDVQRLNQAHAENREIIPTNGNRYDVNLLQRTRTPAYWIDAPNEIRRSKWFYSLQKNSRFIPFEENMDQILENLYISTCDKQSWHLKHEINNGNEIVIFDSPNHMTIQCNNIDQRTKPSYETRIVKRGLPEIFCDEIKQGDKDPVQHLCFVVHGMGAACDMKFRTLIECVEDFRQTSSMILQSHFKSYMENGDIHRVEFLPIYWHGDLHLDSTGVDNHLLPLTLPSVAKVRTFINTTLADILYYTSPVYCQKIVSRCINEMNHLYDLFLQRNPSFHGQVSVIGHSLGSVILYDILTNQTTDTEESSTSKTNTCSLIEYKKLKFPIAYFFALGSPIAMFLTARGITSIATDFVLPTCKGLLNIFHPYDPIAYRLEPLIDPGWTVTPVLLSHHKGRKRIHLELIDGFSKATDLKKKMFCAFKNTMTSVTYFVASYRNPTPELTLNTPQRTNTTMDVEHANDDEETHINEWDNRPIGKLNQGRRIDYVLQHRPIEVINEYIFAFTSHVSYWTSEDTMLLILKEIFQLDGFEPQIHFETIEKMIKSNVMNYFVANQPSKSDELRPYLSTALPTNNQ